MEKVICWNEKNNSKSREKLEVRSTKLERKDEGGRTKDKGKYEVRSTKLEREYEGGMTKDEHKVMGSSFQLHPSNFRWYFVLLTSYFNLGPNPQRFLPKFRALFRDIDLRVHFFVVEHVEVFARLPFKILGYCHVNYREGSFGW